MDAKNIYELLDKFQSDGFTLESLSCITGVPSELITRCADRDKLTHEETMALSKVLNRLGLLYMVDVECDAYLQDTVASLEHFYKLPRYAIASYLGIDLAEFEQLLAAPEKHPKGLALTTKLLHFRNILMQRME